AAPGGAEIGNAGNFGGEADAARAMDATRHDRLDERPHIFVFDRALLLAITVEGGAAIAHRLILEIALAALSADRAVERMVDQQELHHPLARLTRDGRIGVYLRRRPIAVGRDIADLERAGGLGLGRADPLDQAHAAIAGDREALVVAEAGNLGAGELARLQEGQ